MDFQSWTGVTVLLVLLARALEAFWERVNSRPKSTEPNWLGYTRSSIHEKRGPDSMNRTGLSKAIANTTPEQAAQNLSKRGIDLAKFRAESKDHARKMASDHRHHVTCLCRECTGIE